jgi:anti-sigma B factor antagonist
VSDVTESSQLLEIEVIEGGLRLSGEIDASCIDALSSHLDPLPGTTGDVTIHLGNVSFIDSSGLRELIDAHQRAERLGRRVLMSEPSSVVVRLFEISGVSKYLHVG